MVIVLIIVISYVNMQEVLHGYCFSSVRIFFWLDKALFFCCLQTIINKPHKKQLQAIVLPIRWHDMRRFLRLKKTVQSKFYIQYTFKQKEKQLWSGFTENKT